MSGSKSPVYIGAGSAELAVSSALTIIANAATIANHVITTERFAQLTGSTVANADTGVDTNKYSALEYAQGTTVSTGGSAKDWASLTGYYIRGGTTGDMSAKEWAVGILGRLQSGEGSAKDWATRTISTVDGTGYSAKEHSEGVTVPTGTSKQWALGGGNFVEATAVTGSSYSAKKYASDALSAKTDAVSAKEDAVDAKDLAVAAQASVDSTFDNFDDRFLGTFTTVYRETTHAGLDNDGNALSVGAVYYNSTLSQVRFWNGSTWDAPAASAATSATTATTQAGLAEDAKDDAVVAKGAAETAQTNAETAETNAELAETNAETAETNAEGHLAVFQSIFHGASTSTPSAAVSDGDLWFDTNTGVNVMKVYNLSATAWEGLTISALNQTQVNILTARYDGSTSATSGTNLNIAQVDTVADDIANVNTVAGKNTEIGLLGTNAMASGASAYLTVLGTPAMTNTSTGYLKLVGDIDDKITTVAGIDGNVTTVAGVSGNVTTVATNIADVNNFADLYQINDFTTTPTTDGGNNAVAEGDLAYDSTANKLKFYDGSIWQVSTGVTLATVQTEANNAAVAMSIALG